MEEKSKSQSGETIGERVKLRRQKAHDEELFDTSSDFTDENIDEMIYQVTNILLTKIEDLKLQC